jgi:hypothetical protein
MSSTSSKELTRSAPTGSSRQWLQAFAGLRLESERAGRGTESRPKHRMSSHVCGFGEWPKPAFLHVASST